MKTNPSNRNQTLYFDSTYQGLPVMQAHGPMVAEYLRDLHQVIFNALGDYRQVLAFRCDLRFPSGMDASDDVTTNQVISRFIESLKAKIRHHRDLLRQQNGYAHHTSVRYLWAREIGQDGKVHYHCALLVNRDAYFTLGRYDSDQPNMANRIREAWASALGLQPLQAEGLAYFPENPSYHLSRDSLKEIQEFFYRVSYLAKANSKQFGNGCHGFGASRH